MPLAGLRTARWFMFQAKEVVCASDESFPFLFSVGRSIINSGDTSFVPGDVVDDRLNNMGEVPKMW